MPLGFGLQLARFDFPGGPAPTAAALAASPAPPRRPASRALSVMDHVLQIPQVGPEWEDMPESYDHARLPRRRHRARSGSATLVTGVTYRNLAHLAKLVATLDVLSGGRAFCGLGAAWFEREHELYGWDFPPLARALRRCSRTRSSCCR